MRRRLAALALAGAAVLAFTGEQAAPGRGIPFVLARLALDLSVDYGRGAVAGTATLTFRNVSDRAAYEVPLLLGRLMRVTGVSDAAGAPVPFSQEVTVFDDDSVRQVNAVTLRPPTAVAPGDSLRVVVRYAGFLVGYTETGSLYIQDHVSREFTILREDALAFPVLGAPSWDAYRTVRREPFAFEVSAHGARGAGRRDGRRGRGASRRRLGRRLDVPEHPAGSVPQHRDRTVPDARTRGHTDLLSPGRRGGGADGRRRGRVGGRSLPFLVRGPRRRAEAHGDGDPRRLRFAGQPGRGHPPDGRRVPPAVGTPAVVPRIVALVERARPRPAFAALERGPRDLPPVAHGGDAGRMARLEAAAGARRRPRRARVRGAHPL